VDGKSGGGNQFDLANAEYRLFLKQLGSTTSIFFKILELTKMAYNKLSINVLFIGIG
jgi:hypothetical protein